MNNVAYQEAPGLSKKVFYLFRELIYHEMCIYMRESKWVQVNSLSILVFQRRRCIKD